MSEDYLFAIDLYNFAYWWESHEVFEGLWHAFGRSTRAGNFFQALIQLAAANLKQVLGRERTVANLVQRGLERLQNAPRHYLGVDTVRLADHFRLWMNGRRDGHVLIHLALADDNKGSRGGRTKRAAVRSREM
jgi:predicted metal-dependent hydrolase